MLIGGTALAYHLKHRESFDLDICFPYNKTLPSLDFLADFEDIEKIKFDNFTVDTTINEGGDIDEVMQRYIINGVKVDFVVNPASNIYEKEILQNDKFTSKIGSLHIASIDAIFKLKSLLLFDRNKIRDLYDIVYMLKHCKFNGRDFIDTITRYRITYRPKDIITFIEAKQEDPLDYEGIHSPVMNIADYDSLKNELLSLLTDFI